MRIVGEGWSDDVLFRDPETPHCRAAFRQVHTQDRVRLISTDITGHFNRPDLPPARCCSRVLEQSLDLLPGGTV